MGRADVFWRSNDDRTKFEVKELVKGPTCGSHFQLLFDAHGSRPDWLGANQFGLALYNAVKWNLLVGRVSDFVGRDIVSEG